MPKRRGTIESAATALGYPVNTYVFDSPVVSWEDDRTAYGEQRINLLGWLNGIIVHMTYTERGDEPHVISLRKAEKHEIRRYSKEVSD